MKRIISVILAVMMLLSCFAGLSLTASASDVPTNGWYQDEEGNWQYYKDGSYVTGWQKIKNVWYYFFDDGWMACDDWYDINDTYYVFNASGAMLSGGWVKLTRTYSYGDSWTEWFYADKSGACQTGWQKIDSKWYYLEPYAYQGVYEIPEDSDKYYYFGEDCAMRTGWIKAEFSGGWLKSADYSAESTFNTESIPYYGGQTWYYANGSGELQKGWQKIKNVWYYFDTESFRMAIGPREIEKTDGSGSKLYFFNEDGAWVNNGWCELYGSWFYLKDGVAQTGWQKIKNVWYWFDEDGQMVVGGYRIEGKDYLFDGNGKWISNPKDGWHKITVTATMENGNEYTETGWFYIKNGKIATGWQRISGKWYYLMPIDYYARYYIGVAEESEIQTGSLGMMFYNTTVEDNGKFYAFDASGAMITKTGWAKLEAPAYAKSAYGATDEWVYVNNANGELATGWKKSGGKWYYLNEYSAVMVADTAYGIYKDGSDNATYWFFGKDGALVEKAGWASITETYYYSSGTHTYTRWYYLNADGSCYRGWKQSGGKWYYLNNKWLDEDPFMFTGYWTIDGNEYYFDYESGALIEPTEPIVDE